MKKYYGNYGFTLIELLIVIAIIGIIAGISVPKITKVREKANLSVVKADLRSMQTALELFALDNGNQYPSTSQITNIDFDKTEDFKYQVDTDQEKYLIYYPDTFSGKYYYIKSFESSIRSDETIPSL